MKRFLAVTLAALMLLTAASCGKKQKEETTADSTTDTSETTEATEYTPAEQNWPDGFDYASINLAEYVKLGKYKGLTVTLTTSSEITDADVKKYIEDVRTQHSRSVEITDRGAKDGDELVIDYEGTLDGVAFEGGTATGVTLTLGAGGWIDGFEEGMVGMQVGEVKTIDATFPNPYKNNEDLAGKTVQFKITLPSIA